MRISPKLPAVLAIIVAGAIVFSPLIAALTGTGLHTAAFKIAFQPLAGSINTALIAGMVSLLIGAPFAILTERCRPILRQTFWALGMLVLMVPPYIVAEATIVLLGPAGKISRPVAVLFGLGPHTDNPVERARFTVNGFVFTQPAVGIVMGGCLFPIVALAVGSAYRRTDHRIFQAARIMQGKLGVFQITGRLLTAPALGGALLVFAATLTEFAVPQLLRVRSIGEAIYDSIQQGNLSTGAALSLPVLPIVLLAGAIGAVILIRSRSASIAGLEGEVPRFIGRKAGLLGECSAAAMTLLAITPAILIPTTSLIWLSVTAKLPQESVIGGHHLLRASGFMRSLGGAWDLAHDDAVRTVVLATFAATLATLFSIVLVRLVTPVRCGPLLGGLGAGLAVPAAVVGLGLITLWNSDTFAFVYQGYTIVLLGWFARFLPIAVFLVQSALARVPGELEHAAALAGRGAVERFIVIVLPNAMPGIVAAWLAMYVLCATEYSATLLIVPPGSPLLAPSIVNLMRRGQDPEIAACQVLLLAVIALPLLPIAVGAVWKWQRHS
jgi:iron(III) transport system permease protein